MATTAIGTLIPILRDNGELKTRFGTYLLAAGGAGEFGPILLVTLVLSTESTLHESAILLAFIGLALVAGAGLDALGAARLAAARAHLRGLEPAGGAAHGGARLRPRLPRLAARPRPAARRLRRRDDRAAGAAGARAGGLRVEADRGRLRLLRAVLLRRQRDRVRPRGARQSSARSPSWRCSSSSSWSSAGRRRCCSTAACSGRATGPRSPSTARPSCRWWWRSRRWRSIPSTCAPRPRPGWSARRCSRPWSIPFVALALRRHSEADREPHVEAGPDGGSPPLGGEPVVRPQPAG